MAFDQGSLTFRICRLPQPMPEDTIDRFAEFVAPPLETVTDEPSWGWVSPRHLLDTRLDETTVKVAGHYHACLRQAQRKIPSSLLTAECRMVELSRMAERNVEQLNRKERRTIKEEVKQELLPQMPPQLTGIDLAIDNSENLLYVTAASQSQLDVFLGFFTKTFGFEPIPLTPDLAAQELFELDPQAVPQLSLSPENLAQEQNSTLGQNFLTWLWHYQESHNGALPPSKLGDFSILIDGPLSLVAEGAGAFETTLKKGLPTISAEAKAALTTGKKLKKAKIVIARDEGDQWIFTLDADEFVFRGLKLPEGETALDNISIFEDRMTNLFIFQSVFFGLYQKFLAEMTDEKKALEYQNSAREWIRNREAR